MQPIETDRLLLRALTETDSAALVSVFCDDAVMRFSDGIKDPAWIRNFCSIAINEWYPAWGGPYAVTDRSTGDVIGYCGLFKNLDYLGASNDRELGYRFARSWWGRGLGYEAANAVLSSRSATTGINRIVAMVDPDNVASVRILEKLKMRQTGTIMKDWYDHPDLLFEINVDELSELNG